MPVNYGKAWEQNFFNECNRNNITITRLHDVFQGRKSVTNHCDFIVYQYPYEYHLELKSTGTGTFPLTNLSNNQYMGLLQREANLGVVCGLLIQYRKFEKIYFVSIDEVKRFKELGVKSIKHKDIEKNKIKHYEVPSKIKRTNYVLDLNLFLKKIGDKK